MWLLFSSSLYWIFIFFVFWNQVLETIWVRCCSCAMRLVEQPKTKRLGHPEWFFLIELNSCKEGKKGRMNERMNERQRAFKNPNTASTLLLSGFRENCSGVSGTSLMQLKQPHCCRNSSNEPTQNMHSRNSGQNNDSWLLEIDLTSEEIYSSDFLKGFTGREPFEILPLQLRRRPQQKAGTESYFFLKKKNFLYTSSMARLTSSH